MANQKQLAILKKGVKVWNKWRKENPDIRIDLKNADLSHRDLTRVNLSYANLIGARLNNTNLIEAKFTSAIMVNVNLRDADLSRANIRYAILAGASLFEANLTKADFSKSVLGATFLSHAKFTGSIFWEAQFGFTTFGNSDLSVAIGLEDVEHRAPSHISTDTIAHSKGKIPEVFLRGCGLSDWEIEEVKLYNPDLSNDEVTKILYRMYDFRATQALQISPLFISYSHADGIFVDKIGNSLTEKGIRYWRDIHDMKAGRVEKQIDLAIRQNPTVLLVLSKHSLKSDWVQHEVRKARALEKDLGRDVLCPVRLDNKWKNSSWPQHIMEQVMEYNIVDFSKWRDDSKFGNTFKKLIDGLELFYKG